MRRKSSDLVFIGDSVTVNRSVYVSSYTQSAVGTAAKTLCEVTFKLAILLKSSTSS